MDFSSEKFFIVILVGVSGVGKTKVGSLLAHQMGAHLFAQAEIIRQIMRIYNNDAYIHKAALDSWQIAGPNNDSASVIEGFRRHTEAVQPGLLEIIKFSYERGTPLVLEGVAINPAIMDYVPTEICRHLHMCLLTCLNEGFHRDRLQTKLINNPELRINQWLWQNFRNARIIQEYLVSEFGRMNLLKIENENYAQTVDYIIRYVQGNKE